MYNCIDWYKMYLHGHTFYLQEWYWLVQNALTRPYIPLTCQLPTDNLHAYPRQHYLLTTDDVQMTIRKTKRFNILKLF